MCGTHSSQCAAAVANQVGSVLDFAATTIETIVTFGATAGIKVAVNAAEKAAQEAAEAAITATAKATAKAASKALLKEALVEYGKGAVEGLTEVQILNLTAMVAGDKFGFTTLDPTGISAIVAAFNKPICELPPGSNQPVSRFSCQPTYAASNLIFRVSCSNFVRLTGASIRPPQTGQITCYKPDRSFVAYKKPP